MTEERRVKLRRRASWIADRFINERRQAGALICDECGFDPTTVIDPSLAKARSLLDVHHKAPLEEGVRYTTSSDFTLLCPTCHRIEHVRLSITSHSGSKAADILTKNPEGPTILD